MINIDCNCCNNLGLLPFLSFPEAPVSGQFRYTSVKEDVQVSLSLELCSKCGLVRQSEGLGYREYVKVTRSTALQFPAYVHSLIEKLFAAGVGFGDFVLEVGSNDGLFMSALRSAGFTNILGVEPSEELASVARTKGHKVVCDYFGPKLVPTLLEKYGAARAVICRHTLEHVPMPEVFASALSQCLVGDDALVLVEVPDGAAIPDLLNVYEFWDEHLFYFSESNLVRLLQAAGFEVVETAIQPHLETRNLLAWCKKAKTAAVQPLGPEDASCVALWQSLPARWEALKAGFTQAVSKSPGPVYAIGASHSQTNLVNYAGVGKQVDFFIDDDTSKVGMFPPVAETRNAILNSEQFEASANGGTLLKTGFGYERWTQKLCSIALERGMTVLDPKDFIQKYD